MHIYLLKELYQSPIWHTEVILKNYAPFTICISKVNNTQINNAKDIDVVMSMYNLIEYSDDY